eukprot:5039039-Prymnesium_polylepis.1
MRTDGCSGVPRGRGVCGVEVSCGAPVGAAHGAAVGWMLVFVACSLLRLLHAAKSDSCSCSITFDKNQKNLKRLVRCVVGRPRGPVVKM